jgi:phosphoserine phosphatase
LASELQEESRDLGVVLTIEPYVRGGRRKGEKQLWLITTLGKDKPGIVWSVSKVLSSSNANIERMNMISRGELFAMETLVDVSDINSSISDFKNKLIQNCENVGVSVVFQQEDVFKKAKKLLVFDMDSTLIEMEAIDELAKIAGMQDKVKTLTREAMEGRIDYGQALRERVSLLKGLNESDICGLADHMTLVAGTEELVRALKGMGYKIAIISGGFTQFTDRLKEKLGIDYVFANRLVIRDGILTGKLEEPIIDPEKKGELIRQLAKMENISTREIVSIGDSATDRFMLKESGLGIGFRPKELLKKHADGVITENNLLGLLFCLGIPQKKLEELIGGINNKSSKRGK